jgi:hypothetical protein
MKIKYKIIIIAFMVSAAFASCSKWDDFKQYTANGETLYSGKLDSPKVNPGKHRVNIVGTLPADPKIVKCKIKWNDGKDSVVYNIVKSSSIEIFSKIIPVTEGLHNFRIQTFDAAGNSSMISTATGTAYGSKYESGLVNRPIANAEILSSGSAELTWGTFDTTTGAKGTWVKYTKITNALDSVYVPVTQAVTTLPSFKPGTSVTIRTLYWPSDKSIDDFYASAQTVNVMYDVTITYFSNPGINFANSAGGTNRWQTPAAWITTADVRNGGNDIGGLDNGGWLPSKALSIESGFGLPAVPNGKVYQSFTLPAGKYVFVATSGDCSSGATKYLTIARGTSLPDIGSVAATAIVYKIIEKFTDNKLSFTLAAATRVSIGMQAGINSGDHYMKLFKIKLLYSAP